MSLLYSYAIEAMALSIDEMKYMGKHSIRENSILQNARSQLLWILSWKYEKGT